MRGLRLLPIILLILTSLSLVHPQPTIKFYIYGSHYCGSCVKTLSIIIDIYGEESVVFYEATNSTNYSIFTKICDILSIERRWPLTGVFINGKLIAIVIADRPREFWEKFKEYDSSENILRVYRTVYPMLLNITDVEKIITVHKLLTQQEEINGSIYLYQKKSVQEVVYVIVLASLADSVNPCTFSVFTALLLISIATMGKRRMLSIGLAFISAIYIAYTLIGLGLMSVIGYIPVVKYVVGIMAIVAAIYVLSGIARGKSTTTEPKILKSYISSRIRKAVSPLMSFIIGMIVSVTLLPCTAGPYLVAMVVLTSLKNQMLKLPLLLLYNAIFIFPLILIVAGIYTLAIKVKSVKIWRSKRIILLEATEALLLLFLGLYVLFFS
ncbi:MAG: hypothetical protein B6U94_02590 [Thermofilum sp. ex4484_79]|nr:MAG: hypothetical protein B6U94_02590 [Thermofilum sp. ex4484_79]